MPAAASRVAQTPIPTVTAVARSWAVNRTPAKNCRFSALESPRLRLAASLAGHQACRAITHITPSGRCLLLQRLSVLSSRGALCCPPFIYLLFMLLSAACSLYFSCPNCICILKHTWFSVLAVHHRQVKQADASIQGLDIQRGLWKDDSNGEAYVQTAAQQRIPGAPLQLRKLLTRSASGPIRR